MVLLNASRQATFAAKLGLPGASGYAVVADGVGFHLLSRVESSGDGEAVSTGSQQQFLPTLISSPAISDSDFYAMSWEEAQMFSPREVGLKPLPLAQGATSLPR